ncbi:MAG: hypothetical protein ACXAAR_04505 [Candidatus Thorarchaeota archaeon]|jgi:hypothetical protein
MNVVLEQESDLFYLKIFPKCPFFGSATALSIILALMGLGTWGTYYLNPWVAVGYLSYSIVFYFLVMPLTMCRYCYFKVTEAMTDEESGKTAEKLLSVDRWTKSHLHMHVGQKGWALAMAIVWFTPILLIGASLFLNFSPFALLALLGFVVVLVGNYYYMLRVKCPSCPIQEECHSSF